jgi:ABC-type Fe3+ transport system permease subunit/sugar lactone lactonase YvrE
MNWLLLQNSLLVSSATTLLAMVLGFMASLWLAAAERRRRMLGLGLAIVALAVPPFLMTNCWLDLLGANGLLRGWLPLNIFSLPGSAFILALLFWPITTFAVWSRWERLEPEFLEIEPALRGWQLIRHLLLPVARTPLVFSGALTFVLALNNFAVPAILQVKVFPAEMWINFSTNFDTLAALKLSLPLIVAPLVLLLVSARSDFAWPTLRGKMPARVFRRQLGQAWHVASGFVILALGVMSVGVPLLELAMTARTWLELPGAVEAGHDALWNSVWLAAGTATVCVAIALVCGARNLVCFPSLSQRMPGRNRFRVPWHELAWLPFLAPGVLIGVAFIWMLNRPATAWFYSSFGVVLLAFALRYFAIGGSITRHALQTTDSDLNDAARLEGASCWQMLYLVQWPQITAQVAAAWYVIYLLCLWDVESLVLIVPPGGETLALRIFNLLHYGHNAQVNALCLTLLGAAVAPLFLVATLGRARRFLRARAGGESGRVLPSAGMLTIALCLSVAGCSPASSSKSAPLQSKFFERAEVIATRGVGVGEVNKPRSVAVDHNDNLYVVDMTGRVQEFSPQGSFLLAWQMPQTTRGKPKGMGCDNDGNIIVVEPHYKRLNHFNTNGQLVAQWGITGTNAGQLDMPRSVAENSRGEIFVSEYGLVERVQKFSLGKSLKDATPIHWDPNGTDEQALSETRPTPATFLARYGELGGAPGEFNRAEGICVDKQDRLYVADSCNHRVQVFTSEGKFLREFGKPGSGPGELSYPYDIKVDAAGNIFVCEFGNSRIQVFDDNGRSIEIIGGPGVKPGQFNNPWSIALDFHGNLYVADALNHRVQKLVRRGRALTSANPHSVRHVSL